MKTRRIRMKFIKFRRKKKEIFDIINNLTSVKENEL
jgi:hypothetical protein